MKAKVKSTLTPETKKALNWIRRASIRDLIDLYQNHKLLEKENARLHMVVDLAWSRYLKEVPSHE